MKQLKIRLYPDQDALLLDWLEELDQLSYGVKSKTIKETLLRGLNLDVRTPGASSGTNAAFDTGELLSDIRRVMEATLESAVSRLAITPLTAVRQPNVPEPDDAIDALLDDFGANLMMLDEE